jgi:hypothetical protein
VSWDLPFDVPIAMPDGRRIETLAEARAHILTHPKKVLDCEHWQLAMEMLLMAAEKRGPVLHAQIAFVRAVRAHMGYSADRS